MRENIQTCFANTSTQVVNGLRGTHTRDYMDLFPTGTLRRRSHSLYSNAFPFTVPYFRLLLISPRLHSTILSCFFQEIEQLQLCRFLFRVIYLPFLPISPNSYEPTERSPFEITQIQRMRIEPSVLILLKMMIYKTHGVVSQCPRPWSISIDASRDIESSRSPSANGTAKPRHHHLACIRHSNASDPTCNQTQPITTECQRRLRNGKNVSIRVSHVPPLHH